MHRTNKEQMHSLWEDIFQNPLKKALESALESGASRFKKFTWMEGGYDSIGRNRRCM